jgi:hypothetical protein
VSFNQEVARDSGRYFSGPRQLARECELVESRPYEARARGRAGQADVTERYQWDRVADEYEKLAHELELGFPCIRTGA